MCFACGSLLIACSNLPFSFTFFPTCFEMRFSSPFESSVYAFSSCRTKIDNTKTKIRIIKEANNFILRMHLAIPWHYQMPIEPCIIIRGNYTLPPLTITHFSLHLLNFKKYQLTPKLIQLHGRYPLRPKSS